MPDSAAILNALSHDEARRAFTHACGAERWVDGMLSARPFDSTEHMLQAAEQLWNALPEPDVLEALRHHPRIGADLAVLRARFFASEAALAASAREQAQVAQASEATLRALRDANAAYEARFGFVFLVFATGKSADEMLALCTARLGNDRHTELDNARREHVKITALRLSRIGEHP